jgi:glycosyltransferase involved in cell wall biosynthesis
MIGAFGGASRSLLEVVRAIPPGRVEAYFVTPKGTASECFREVAAGMVEVKGMSQFDNTRYSHYRGIRWLVLLRELYYFPFTIWGLVKAKHRWKSVDLIHLNEFTGIIPCLVAKCLFSAPVVVHVRSLARMDPGSLRTRWMNQLLRHAEAIVAIDENVRASLSKELSVDVIHNSFSLEPPANPDMAMQARFSKLSSASFKVGFIGNLLRVKGLFDLVEAARLLKDRNIDVEYVVIGDSAQSVKGMKQRLLKFLGLTQDIKEELMLLIEAYGLLDRFHFLGFAQDIQRAYREFDVLCFPSHYDAPGRPIFEAAFLGVPSIVAVHDPLPDTLIDGETGLAVPPQAPERLADAINFFVTNPEKVRQMGENASKLAHENFDVHKNALKLLAIYDRCA